MTVSVGFTLSPDGVPDQNSMRIAGYQGGSESAAQQGFEVARRAILMCGRAGFDLPASKYGAGAMSWWTSAPTASRSND